MKSTRKILIGVMAVAGLATATAIAYADPSGGFGPGQGACRDGGPGPGMMRGGWGGGPMMGPGMMRGGPGRGPGFSPSAMVEGRLAALKSELNITANQESAWQAFATKAKQQVESMQARRAQAVAPLQTAPERLAQRTEFAKQRAANVEAMSAAVKDLYDALTPEQKALADQRLAFGGMRAAQFGPRGHGRWN